MSDFILPREIVNKEFKKAVRGYDTAQVDSCLEQLAAAFYEQTEQLKKFEQKILRQTEQLSEYEKMRSIMHETLLNAQKTAEESIANAKAEAERIIASATDRAAHIEREIFAEKQAYVEELKQIKQIRDLFITETRGIIAKFDRSVCEMDKPTAASLSADKIISEPAPSAAEDQPEPCEKTVGEITEETAEAVTEIEKIEETSEIPEAETETAEKIPAEAETQESQKKVSEKAPAYDEEKLLRLYDKSSENREEPEKAISAIKSLWGKIRKPEEEAQPAETAVSASEEETQEQLFTSEDDHEEQRIKDRAIQYALDENDGD